MTARGSVVCLALVALVVGCGGKGEPAPAPAPEDPAAGTATKDPGEAKTTEPPAATTATAPDATTGAADPAPTPTPTTAAPETTAAPASAEADAGNGRESRTDKDILEEYALPPEGTVITAPVEGTPEWVIQRVIAASMNPDEAAGWAEFEALLHTSEKLPNALISRRELNYPASRRKVGLFIVGEDKTTPVYKIAYIETPAEDTLKIFVDNPKSSPTPCYIRKDPAQDNQWKVTTCSL